mmetsp:Transcript_118158/g.329500  ORF Transcript_118158/g.329500 Transcript_118158/m.329500 type:complete len:294 (-) Transcript_118158:1601-2482(-)
MEQRIVEALHEDLGIPAQEVGARRVCLHQLLELRCMDLHDLTACAACDKRAVELCTHGPKGRFAGPLALADKARLLSREGRVVLKEAVDHKDHLLHDFPVQQCILACPQGCLGDRRGAERGHDVGVEAEVLAEEGVAGDHGHKDFLTQLLFDRLRQHPQERDVVALQASLPERGGVVLAHRPPDAARQLVRDLVGAQEDADLAFSRHPRSVDIPDVRHGLSDAADEGGEYYQREDDHHDVEEALVLILWENLHGGGRELRQGPMERRGVGIREAHFHVDTQGFTYPRWVRILE